MKPSNPASWIETTRTASQTHCSVCIFNRDNRLSSALVSAAGTRYLLTFSLCGKLIAINQLDLLSSRPTKTASSYSRAATIERTGGSQRRIDLSV